MSFEVIAQFGQLLVQAGHLALQVGDGLGRTDARDDVLALRIGQVLPVHRVFAGSRVAREADARRAVVTHVAEDHRHDIDGRTVGHVFSDFEFAPVIDGSLAHPGVEHRLDGDFELLVRIGRERFARVLLYDVKKAFADLPQVLRPKHHIGLDACAVLDSVEFCVE